MKLRWISLGLFLSFLICYFQWGHQSMFLFQMEADVLLSEKRNLHNFSHPLIILPFIGQLLLLVPLFKKNFPLKFILVSNILLSLLVFMVLLSGVLSMNVKMVLSTLPFIFFTVLLVRAWRSERIIRKSSRLRP
ncbi:MAG: hypothetical protein U0Y08_14595 [Bacteroidia bacterium]